MTLAEDVPFFEIDLGRVDILLAASDFCGAAASSDYTVIRDPNTGLPCVELKGRAHPCVFLEEFFQRFFTPDIPADAAESTAFLMRRAEEPDSSRSAMYGQNVDRGVWAFIVQRNFEMRSHSIREMRLIPPGVRPGLSAIGVNVLRFQEKTRVQFLVDLKSMKPAPCLTDGGGA